VPLVQGTTIAAHPRTRATAQRAIVQGGSLVKNRPTSVAAGLSATTRDFWNTADLEWPADARMRDEFRHNTFPPSGGSTPLASPTPPPAASAK